MEGLTEIVAAFGGWAEVGGLAFGGLCFIFVITGQLMPRRTFITVEKDRDTYKLSSETKDKTIATQAKTIEYLSREVGATVVQAMEGLPEVETEEEQENNSQLEEHTEKTDTKISLWDAEVMEALMFKRWRVTPSDNANEELAKAQAQLVDAQSTAAAVREIVEPLEGLRARNHLGERMEKLMK